MIAYRTAKPEERDAYIELANYAFGFDAETLLPKVYDPAFDPSSITKVAVHESGKLCAEVAVLPQNLTVCGKALKAGFLGMVSVHPKFRGQGHMKALMQMWTEEARSRYDMLVLYGQRQRYEYFGFTGGGMRRQFFVEPANIRHALKDVSCEGFTFRPFFGVEGAAAFAERLNRARLSFVERKAEEMELIFRCLNQKATAILKDGKLAGYLITDGSGREISELALEHLEDCKPAIKAYAAFLHADRLSLYVPDYETELNAVLQEFAERYLIDCDCMFHIVDYANVLEAYLTLKHRSVGLSCGRFSAVLEGQAVTVTVNEAGVSVERKAEPGAPELDKAQAQSLLLTERSRFLKWPVMRDWFPLPIFWYIVDKF